MQSNFIYPLAARPVVYTATFDFRSQYKSVYLIIVSILSINKVIIYRNERGTEYIKGTSEMEGYALGEKLYRASYAQVN